jgi:cephalosporin-C deacetylase
MALFDLSLAELREFKPERQEPADFDRFWRESLAETAVYPLNAVFYPGRLRPASAGYV